MWKRCAAEGCSTDLRKKGKYGYMQDIEFYAFPTQKKAPKDRRKWLELLRRKDYDPPRNHRVCSLHFVDGRPTKENPFPTLFSYNNYKKSRIHRSEEVMIKRRATTTCSSKQSESDEVNSKPVMMDIPTDSDISIPVHGEVEVRSLQSDSLGDVGISGDHDYLMSSTCPTFQDCSMQTDLTMDDMKQYDKRMNDKEAQRDLLVDMVTSSDSNVRKYLGLPSIEILFGIFAILEDVWPRLSYWKGPKGTPSTTPRYQQDSSKKSGPSRKLSMFHEFVLTLLRIRLGLPSFMLADLFGVSVSRVSQITTTWINFLYVIFAPFLSWQNAKRVKRHMPGSFKKLFPKTTCIIDCTEFNIHKPATPSAQAMTYSSYKHKNTFKALVAITPNGAFSFISNLWGGNVSDRYITEHSGFLDKIKPNDEVMADRGFVIRDLLLERRATLNIPPFTKKCAWGKGRRLTSSDIKRTKNIAKLRIHVERAIGRLKNYKLLSNTLPLKLKPISNQLLKVCAFFCNLQEPLVKA